MKGTHPHPHPTPLFSPSAERSAAVPADTSALLCLPALAAAPDSRGNGEETSGVNLNPDLLSRLLYK